ncbi:MAG: hypothetical protein JJU00_20445, partial [Opitutales bacterium]|nr:hypothetical protein [Opitutales bacterium]
CVPRNSRSGFAAPVGPARPGGGGGGLSTALVFCAFAAPLLAGQAAYPWSGDTYPDEAGFKERTAEVVTVLAQRGYLRRQMSRSRCPDTGYSVFLWALPGEDVVSPYTGSVYTQEGTGYFGPRRRDADGRIDRFGGDSLKHGLIPPTARLLIDPEDRAALGFVRIPGNLHQQYHFAAINWARFLGLHGACMDSAWQADFARHVADYREASSPINRPGEFVPLTYPHDLVGEEGEPLGGNRVDGGTENHKLMWRTSGLLYAELLPEGAEVSGYPADEARRRTRAALAGYLEGLLETGNGEYNSTIYYPYIVHGLLNLYDFSPDAQTRSLAKAILDYYMAVYALKSFNGYLSGPQKRGFSWGPATDDHFDALFWGWCAETTARPRGETRMYSLHQATSRYRPNALIHRLAAKDVELPFTARMTRPDIRMERAGIALETLHVSRSFALGSAVLRDIEVPSQETRWVLNVRAEGGSALITGGHPQWREPMGVTPHDQVAQAGGAALLLTSPNAGHLVEPPPGQLQYFTYSPAPAPAEEGAAAPAAARAALRPYARPRDRAFPFPRAWTMAPASAVSWLYVSRRFDIVHEEDAFLVLSAPETWVVVRPFGGDWGWLLRDGVPELDGTAAGRRQREALRDFRVLAVDRLPGGFAVEAVERHDMADLSALKTAVRAAGEVTLSAGADSSAAEHTTVAGRRLGMESFHRSLEPRVTVDGGALDFDEWTGGLAVDIPFLRAGGGTMRLAVGGTGYEVTLSSDGVPAWRALDSLDAP